MKKIEYAVSATGMFIRHLHRGGFDRGMIATFGNTFRVEQGFTSSEQALHLALGRVLREPAAHNEGTRLYDSIDDVITQFWTPTPRGGDRSRPWILTIVTDGMNNANSRHTATSIGRRIAADFNHEPTNFIFLVGVGSGREIDESALVTIGDTGGFLAVTLEAFSLLERLFLEIALEVSTTIATERIEVGNLSWEEVMRIREISEVAIDYAFLIDRSGSMGHTG